MDTEIFLNVDRQVTAIAIVTASVLIVNQLARLRRTTLLHRTIREAVGSNSPLAPALIAKLDEKPTFESDARSGIILLAVAIALILFGLIQAGGELLRSFVAVAMFPAVVGVALVLRSRFSGQKVTEG